MKKVYILYDKYGTTIDISVYTSMKKAKNEMQKLAKFYIEDEQFENHFRIDEENEYDITLNSINDREYDIELYILPKEVL